MALILCVETSSKNCSVAIADNGVITNFKEKIDQDYCHGEQLHVLINELLIASNITLSQLDALALSSGPGSYTGLRIGAAAVKGLAVVINKNIIQVSTLQSMAWAFLQSEFFNKNSDFDYFCPVLDSRKGEVYCAIYNSDLHPYLHPSPQIVTESLFLDFIEDHRVCFFGPGKYKLEEFIHHKNVQFTNDIYPSSKYLGVLAETCFQNKEFVDTAYFEPLYLKEFVPTKPKN